MTIRRSVNIAEINKDFTYFLDGCENAPDGMFTQALDIRDRVLGYTADEFLRVATAADLMTCNSDGIREIEAMMFAMLREKNPNSQIEQTIGLGKALEHAGSEGSAVTKQDILDRLVSDRNFVQSQRQADVDALLDAVCEIPVEHRNLEDLTGRAVASGHITPEEGSKITTGAGLRAAPPGSYRADCDELEAGDGDMWSVRVESSADESEYVDLHVRADTMENAALKAEAHAAKHADMYFDDSPPTYRANRHDMHRIDENGDEVDDSEERYTGSDAPFPGGEA
jgi:hypothetical protein